MNLNLKFDLIWLDNKIIRIKLKLVFLSFFRMPIELFTEAETHYTITFNKALSNKGQKKKRRDSDAEDPGEGPIVDRRCCKCGHERMSYAALQLR